MPTLGSSVVDANAILNRLRNVPSVYSVCAASLHIGFPGIDGLDNQYVVTTRQILSLDEPDNGIMQLLTPSQSYALTAPGVISHIALWSSVDPTDPAGVFIAPGVLIPARTVAAGDNFNLGTCKIYVPGLVAE